MKRMLNSQQIYWLTLLAAGIVFFAVNALTPMWGDDYIYGFVLDGQDWTTNRIDTLREFGMTAYNHWMHVNGRLLSNLFQQFWGMQTSKSIFDVCNALVFVLFFYLISQPGANACDEYSTKVKRLAICMFAMVVLTSSFKLTHLWQTGSCNYLWVATCLLILRKIYERNEIAAGMVPLACVFSLLCGWSHEVFSFPLSCVFGYVFLREKHYRNKRKAAMFLCFLIGTLLILVSPGMHHRASTEVGVLNDFSVAAVGAMIARGLYYSRMTYIIFAMLLLIALRKMRCNRWFFCSMLAWGLAIVSGKTYGSVHYGAEFFALLSLLEGLSLTKFGRRSAALVLCVSMGVLVLSLPFCYANYANYKSVIQQINSLNSVVITERKELPLPIDRNVLYMGHPETEFMSYGTTQSMADYYGVHKLNIIPGEFYRAVKNGEVKGIYTTESLNFFAKKWEKSKAVEGEFIFSASWAEDIPVLNKIEKYRLRRMLFTQTEVVNIDGQNYALILKPVLLKDRISEVRIYNN